MDILEKHFEELSKLWEIKCLVCHEKTKNINLLKIHIKENHELRFW